MYATLKAIDPCRLGDVEEAMPRHPAGIAAFRLRARVAGVLAREAASRSTPRGDELPWRKQRGDEEIVQSVADEPKECYADRNLRGLPLSSGVE